MAIYFEVCWIFLVLFKTYKKYKKKLFNYSTIVADSQIMSLS